MNNKMIYGLYVIINTSKDNKSYIGYTSQIKTCKMIITIMIYLYLKQFY